MKGSILGLTAATALLAGCASPLPVGSLYTGVKLPVSATANPNTATKTGTSKATSILGMVATGDASIEAAKQAGGITKVIHVDHHAENILGLYGTYTTVVYGE